MEQTNLYLDQKTVDISTRESACEILNENPDFKSHCRYYIPNLFNQTDDVEYVHFYISSAIIPVSFYIINENNNRLYYIENSIETFIDFDYGNYNVNTFMEAFRTKMPNRFSISLNSSTSKLTITNTTYEFSFLENSTISAIMGFSETIFSSSKTITMTRCVNFLSLSRISVRCPELASNIIIGNEGLTNDVILTVPNNSQRVGGVVTYDNTGVEKNILNVSSINSFTLALTDDDGNFLNFNGIPSYFTLNFDVWRRLSIKQPSFYSTLKEHYKKNKNTTEEIQLLNLYPKKTIDFF